MSMGLRGLIASDFARYEETYRLRGQSYSRTKVFLESLFLKAGFQAVLLYRLSHWLHTKNLGLLAWMTARLSISFTGAEIEYNAKIGPGLFIAHPVGIVIGRGTEIGSHAALFQGSCFAAKSWHPSEIKKFPKAGDHCFFFAHAVILGGITIGNSCVIGANTVVTKDMPEGSLAKGNPAEIVPDRGREYVNHVRN